MIKKELLSVIYDKKKLCLMIFFILIVCLDAFLAYRESFLYEYLKNPIYDFNVVKNESYHVAQASFLSSVSHGHIPQKIIIWNLPLYFLFLSSNTYIQEHKLHYYSLLSIRMSQKKIYIEQCFSSFIIAFFLSLIATFMNFIICFFLFHEGTMFIGLNLFHWLHPNITYFIYILIFSIVCGILSASMRALSYAIPYSIPLYTISFGVWFYQIGAHNSITFLLQPFIEYGWNRILPAIIFFLLISSLFFILGYIKKVYYENL